MWIDLSNVGLTKEDIEAISRIHIVACGSAWHVGMVAQYVIEDMARIPVRVELASEFRYRKPILDKDDLVIIISQSRVKRLTVSLHSGKQRAWE